MKARDVFKKRSLSIGWIDTDFIQKYGDDEVNETASVLPFKVLPRAMYDSEIKTELGAGTSSLGNVFAFLKDPPEGTKDGSANMFYVEACVVSMHWSAISGEWVVSAWCRNDRRWGAGYRVFTPATETSGTPDAKALPTELVINGITYRAI